jgi:hypothetical protein
VWTDRTVQGRSRSAATTVAVGVVVACCATGPAYAGSAGVVELFTSQGCSSCPPADRVFADIAADPDIVALTFAVDYWDYLGWRDTFAKPEFSRRQRAYADGRGDRAVYTPQVVVNGRLHMIGSDKERIMGAVESLAGAGEGLSIDVSARVQGDRIVVHVPAGKLAVGTTSALWIASYRQPETVSVDQGENAGHEVTYINVVDRWQVLGMWDGEEMTVELPLADIAQDRTAGFAVVLQSKKKGRPGPILGAAKVDLAVN